jgi:hypothetical protein
MPFASPPSALLPHPDRLLGLARWLELSGLPDAAATARTAAEVLAARVAPGGPSVGDSPVMPWANLALAGTEGAGE